MEMRVAAALEFKDYEMFLPTYKERRSWSDRIKVIELPLFSGYVFCRLRHGCEALAITTPGVRRIVGFGGKICPIQDEEIEVIRKLISSGDPLPAPYIKVGQKVEVTNGPFAGVMGIISRIKNKDFVTHFKSRKKMTQWFYNRPFVTRIA